MLTFVVVYSDRKLRGGEVCGVVEWWCIVGGVCKVKVDVRAPKYLCSFAPTIDRRSVLPRHVRRLMSKPREAVFAGVALLVGLSRVDAAFYLTGRDLVDGLDAGRLRRMLRTYVQNTFSYHRQYIYDVLVHQYTDWQRTVADAGSRRDSLVELLADGLYVAPSVELAQRHAALAASATYMYILHYPSRVTGTSTIHSTRHGALLKLSQCLHLQSIISCLILCSLPAHLRYMYGVCMRNNLGLL